MSYLENLGRHTQTPAEAVGEPPDPSAQQARTRELTRAESCRRNGPDGQHDSSGVCKGHGRNVHLRPRDAEAAGRVVPAVRVAKAQSASTESKYCD